MEFSICYSKTCLKRPLKKKNKIGFQDRFLLNAGQKYCRMLPLELSAVLSTFIKLPFANKIFVLSIFEWRLKTGYTVHTVVLMVHCIFGGVSYNFQKILYYFLSFVLA